MINPVLSTMAINWTQDGACTKEHVEEFGRLQASIITANEYMREVIIATADAVALIRQVDFEHDHRFEYEINPEAESVKCTATEYLGHGDYDEYYLDFPLSYMYDWAAGKALEEAKREERRAAMLKQIEESRAKKEADYRAHRAKLYEELKREFEK